MARSLNTSDDAPIEDAELEGLFGSLRSHGMLILAVSGGSDSTALMHLAHRWLTRQGACPPTVHVATIDHGLRVASLEEARTVEAAARSLSLEHATLTWTAPKPATGLQAAARRARYELLFAHAHALRAEPNRPPGPIALLTAHTLDDQGETVLMRLQRGSGIDGLAGIAPRLTHDGIDLVRPLIGVPKSRLVATLRALGAAWIEDPSNADTRFERVGLRENQQLRLVLGLSNEALARTASRARRASALFQTLTGPVFGPHSLSPRFGFEEWQQTLTPGNLELEIRRLRQTIEAVGGTGGAVGLGQVEALTEALALPTFKRATLGRCQIVKLSPRRALSPFWAAAGLTKAHLVGRQLSAPTLVIARETTREPLATMPLEPGATAIFDGRFAITLSPECKATAQVRPLDAQARTALEAGPDTQAGWWHAVPASLQFLLHSQPVVWLEGKPISAPTLGLGQSANARFIGHELVRQQSDFEPES